MSFPTPTANMHTKLNVPALHPHWATDTNATLEPAEGQKGTGWVVDKKAPARWMNWLQNLLCAWTLSIGMFISNWFEGDLAGAAQNETIIYSPTLGRWMLGNYTTTTTYSTVTGHNWASTAGALSASPSVRSIAIDGTYFIFGCSDGQLNYSADGASWSQVSSATLGGTGAIFSVCTKYPDSYYTIILRANGAPRISTTGLGGSWVAATTPPASKAAPVRVLYLGGTTWAALLCDAFYVVAVLYVSTDDGDTWAAATTDPTSTSKFNDMAYCPDTGRIIIVGETTGGAPTIEYTDDLGVTWNVATQSTDYTLSSEFWSVYCCGGGLWVAVGEYDTANPDRPHVQVSKDNGETWNIADLMDPDVAGNSDYHALACDGKKVVACGESGRTLVSLSLV